MQNNDILDLFNQLTDFQKDRIQRELRSYIQFNEFVESSHYAQCPVCGIADANVNHFFHRYGKQFFQEYGKEFFLTYGKQNFQG